MEESLSQEEADSLVAVSLIESTQILTPDRPPDDIMSVRAPADGHVAPRGGGAANRSVGGSGCEETSSCG